MSNFLHLGFSREIELPKAPFLLLHDEADIDHLRPKVFDPDKHSFNPLEGITDKRAVELRSIFYAINPQGENTLTVRNGKWAMRPALKKAKSLADVEGGEEVGGVINDIRESPVLNRVFCGKPNFKFESQRPVFARVSRAELGDDDALVLGLMLMSVYPGQIVVPDFGFYGRKIHRRLIREERLIAGVDMLDDLPPELRGVMMKMPYELSGATVKDAKAFLEIEGKVTGTVGYNDALMDNIA